MPEKPFDTPAEISRRPQELLRIAMGAGALVLHETTTGVGRVGNTAARLVELGVIRVLDVIVPLHH